jgi:predicted aspartyl protease
MNNCFKYFLTTFASALLFLNTGFSQSATLDSLIRAKSYFMAQDLYDRSAAALPKVQQLHYGAILDNAFNRPAASNLKIDQLEKSFRALMHDADLMHLMELRQENFARLYEYRKAAQAIDAAIGSYGNAIGNEQLADLQNTRQIWSSLADAPKQQVLIRKETSIKMIQDKAGLRNLPVKRDSVSINFVFDTGANLSTVTETTAKRMGMRMIEADIEVNSITGNKVRSQLAVCPEFELGGITVRNAVFLVFPDSALSVPQIGYRINGIIGFPVIEGMKEVRISKEGFFTVPLQRSAYGKKNLALEFLTPLLRIGDEIYSFDSGAGSTILYKPYFDKHRSEIEKDYDLQAVSYAGAGGAITRDGYRITWSPLVCDRMLNVKNVMVFADAARESESYFFGNIGQDVIGEFDVLVLNFDKMFVWLK